MSVLDMLQSQNAQNLQSINDNNNSIASANSNSASSPSQAVPDTKYDLNGQPVDPNQQNNNSNKQSDQQPAANTDNGNWFSKLLPTIGSLALPAIGAALAPETGGLSLLATLPAGVALSAAGSAAGKAVENATEGKNVADDLGSSALEGGIGQVAGGALGKVAGAVTGTVAKGAEKATADMIQKQFGDQIDKQTAQHLFDHGVTSRQDAMNIANHVTGSEGHLPQAINKAFQNSDKVVNISDLDPTALKTDSNIFNMDRAGLNPTSQKTALANAKSILESQLKEGDVTNVPLKGGKGSVPVYGNGVLQNTLPENAFGMAKQFEKLGYQADSQAYDKAGNAINPQQAALGTYYKNIASELNSRAFGVGQDAVPLTDDIKQEIIGNLSGIQKSNPQAYDLLSKQINEAQNLQDLRGIQAPWVNVAKGDRVANAIANGQGGVSAGEMLSNAAPVVGAGAGGAKGLAAGLALKAMNSQAGNSAGAGILNRIAGVLGSPGMEKVVAAGTTIPTQVVTHAPTDFTGAAGSNQSLTVPGAGDVTNNPNLYGEVMNSNSLYSLPVQSALINQEHRQVGDNQNYLSDPGVLAAIAKLQGPAAIQAQLPELIQAYNAAGGAQGAAGGLLANLGGMVTGGPAAQYQARANALASSIHDATGQNVTLPSLTMNQAAAQSTLAQLVAALNASGSTLTAQP